MISAPLPSLGPPKELCTPRPANPWEGPVQVDPCQGGKEQLHDPGGASSSFPPLIWGDLRRRKKAKRNLSGLEGASHTPEQAGKGKCRQGGHGGGDESSWDTQGEGEENSDREQRGQAGVGGRLISASSSKKKK